MNYQLGVDLTINDARISGECVHHLSNDLLLYPFATFDDILYRPNYPTQKVYTRTLNGILDLVVYATDDKDWWFSTLYRYGGNKLSQITITNGAKTASYTVNRGDNDPYYLKNTIETITLYNNADKSEVCAVIKIDWKKINLATGLSLTKEHYKIQEACICRIPKNVSDYKPYCEFIEKLTDYYVTDTQQRLYFNEIADFDNIGYFAVSASGATYPEVTWGENGVSGYVEFNVTATKNFTVTISYIYHGTVIARKTINVHAKVGTTLPSKKYMFIGDSLTEAGKYEKQFKEMNADGAVTLYGTRGNGAILHEGRSGWNSTEYISIASKGTVTNPFYNPTTKTFDFSYYMTNNSRFSDVDIVVVFLGRNDGFSAKTIANVKKIIESIHSFNANIKCYVIGGYNVACDSNGTGKYLQGSGGLNRSAFVFNNTLFYPEFSANGNVKPIPMHLNLDNKYDYTTTEIAISNVDTRTRSVYTDNVHPDERGYKKFGIAINAFFHNELA